MIKTLNLLFNSTIKSLEIINEGLIIAYEVEKTTSVCTSKSSVKQL